MSRKLIIEIISLLVIALFFYAAVSKLLDYQNFRVTLGQSPLLTSYARWIAWMIPAVEILLSIMLVMPKFRIWGLYGSFGLMSIFTVYLIIMVNFFENIPCSCGGILSSMPWATHIYFNIGVVVLLLIAIILSLKEINAMGAEKNRFNTAS